jgi:hypothetical protein
MEFWPCQCYQLVVPSRCSRMLPGIESEQSGSSFADTGGHQRFNGENGLMIGERASQWQ